MKKEKLESAVLSEVIEFLTLRGWYCKRVHGNAMQSGFPDLFCCHVKYGTRWIETKCPPGHKFMQSQLETFQKFCSNGTGVWVMRAATNDEYLKLFKPPNWWHYLTLIKK